MKQLLIILGTISLALGVIGIFVPVLPTTPFLLLTAFLYAHSSESYILLLNHKILGPYIRNFLQEKAIPLRIKIVSIATLWITITCSALFAASGKLWLQILLFAIAVCVTIHILSYKTMKN